MRINTNISALNAHRQLGINTEQGTNAMERLSSGLRINRAGDDAAGLAISEKMRGQIRGLKQASRNAQDGISLIQTAEGALNETHAILQRMRELAVQSSTDTNTDDDRLEIQKEITQLTREVDRIARTTQFNTMELLDGSYGGKVFHIGANDTQSLAVDIANMRADALKIVGTEPTGAAPSTDPTGSAGATKASVAVTSGIAVAGSTAAITNTTGDTVAFGTIEIADPSSFDLDGGYTLTVTASASGDNFTASLATSGGTAVESGVAVEADSEVTIGGLKFTIATANLPAADASISVTFDATPYAEAKAGVDSLEIAEDSELDGEYTLSIAYSSSDGVTAKLVGAEGTVGSVAITSAGNYTIGDITFAISGDNIPTVASENFEVKFTATPAPTEPGGAGATEPGNTITGQTTVAVGSANFDVTVTAPEGSAYEGITIKFATGDSAGAAYSEGTITVTLQAGDNYNAAAIQELIRNATGAPEGVDFSEFAVAAGTGFAEATGTQWAAADDITLGEGEKEPAAKEVFDESTLHGINVDTQEAADKAIEAIDEAIVMVSAERSKLGAMQNRLEHTIANLGTSAENLQAAESRIRDLDMAEEIMQFTKANILNQAATAMLAQANMAPQTVLQLLG